LDLDKQLPLNLQLLVYLVKRQLNLKLKLPDYSDNLKLKLVEQVYLEQNQLLELHFLLINLLNKLLHQLQVYLVNLKLLKHHQLDYLELNVNY
jgi:hypothetical protein